MTPMSTVDLLKRKETHFILWRPGATDVPPTLFIGKSTESISQFREIPLAPSSSFPELWEVDVANCNLEENKVYFFWFKVRNTDPYDSASFNQVLYCTDPIAYTIDRGTRAPVPQNVTAGKTGITDSDPASVILHQGGKLIPCDPDGRVVDWTNDLSPSVLPSNNSLVIYELPTRWTRVTSRNTIEIGNGTFQDALALLIPELSSITFPTVAALNNRAHLLELGINALELLPPADSNQVDNWGYGTSNFFAADYDLGFPAASKVPSASLDLVKLIKTCHEKSIRFFKDTVMAFSSGTAIRNINFLDFFVKSGSGDPEQDGRDGFGGDLIKYNYRTSGYDPLNGSKTDNLFPSRAFLKAYLFHWMTYYRVDGLRLDSVNNIKNYDFLQEVKDFSHSLWKERGGRDDNFLVIGESIGFQRAMLDQKRLDSFWNEDFKNRVKPAVVGKSYGGESFETSIRKMIDCRDLNLGFTDGSQVINYITSHDVEGVGAERLYNYLDFNRVFDKEKRIKLAFVCLLTAVGIPMILAGDEFADQMDNDIFRSDVKDKSDRKHVDPVNFSRLDDDWRKRVFYYVARLVKFRTASKALAVNDTNFIHLDFNQGKRVLVWTRGSGDNIVVVVANFSDWGTADPLNPNSQYIVPNWPNLPSGKKWREITQEREVPNSFAGKESIFPWEAKVYAAV